MAGMARAYQYAHFFSYFLCIFSHSYSTNGEEGHPPPSQLLNYRLHALITTRGGHPPLSALFLALDPTRGGQPPLSPCFLMLVITRGGYPPFSCTGHNKGRSSSPLSTFCHTCHNEGRLSTRHQNVGQSLW